MLFTVLVLLSLLLQIAGIASPAWFIIDYGSGLGITVKIGLWYMLACRPKCHVITIHEYRKKLGSSAYLFTDTMLEYQVETTIALICCVVAVLSFCRWERNHQDKGCIGVALISTLASGTLACVAAGTFGKFLYNINKVSAIFGYTIQPPYSLIATGAGGIFAALAVFFPVHALCTTHRQQTGGYGQPMLMATYS